LIGHALDVPSGVDGLLHVMAEAKELGPLFKLRVFDREINFVSGLDLVTELSDETRFRKNLHPDLVLLRDVGGDGLFTAYNDEPNWQKAHDVLMPAFSLGTMRGYHSTMLDAARALIAKWDQADGAVDVVEDMTPLTFDTIGLCGFGHDFESFSRTEPHPFVTALPWTGLFQWGEAERFREDLACMRDLVDDVIRHQAITFIIAGHETTSGALSFALHYLTKHPEALARGQSEVDALWGDAENPEPEYGDIGKLTYVRQVLNESLRLWPTAPVYAVEPVEDTVIGGRYAVRKGEGLLVLIPALHRDPAWGGNVELFDPERFAPEREESRPVHLFKPFGNGERACIGCQFALHEATLVLALLVHRYRFIDHADHRLKIKQTLTLKPEDFTLRLARRTSGERRPATTPGTGQTTTAGATTVSRAAGTALALLHGSNLGTCAGIAGDLATDGDERGFATTVAPLNDLAGRLTADGRRMAPAVREAFQELYRKHTGGDERQAALWFAGLQESGRYVEDVWAG
jgi:cytochrome P450/NADPH-cytochrome P450 reductase